MLGSQRRLVRRWECDTDLPNPGAFPQISQTAAIRETPPKLWGQQPHGWPGDLARIAAARPNRQTINTRAVPCHLCCRLHWIGWRPPIAARGGGLVGSGSGRPDRPLDASVLRDWAHTAVGDLITHIDEINQLNVFPVADSDTGINMLFTMRSALAEANTVVNSKGRPADVVRVAAALSAGALNGARGNSGVILSQILRGIADVTAGGAAESGGELLVVDVALLGAALHRGVDLVVASMGGQEVPGTIVSVLQAAADAVEQCATTGEGLARAVTAAGDAAVVALEKTPEQLDVLGDAGVVDAGGRGLVVLLDALRSTITGQAPNRKVYEPAPHRPAPEIAAQPPAPQFEVMYLLGGCDAEGADLLRERLDELGESVAIATSGVVGGYSVHVHTDDAGAAIEAGLMFGDPRRIQIS